MDMDNEMLYDEEMPGGEIEDWNPEEETAIKKLIDLSVLGLRYAAYLPGKEGDPLGRRMRDGADIAFSGADEIYTEPDVLEQQWRYLIVRYNNKPGYLPTGFVAGGERRTAMIGILTHAHTFAVVPDEDGLELQISFVVEEERGGGDKKDDKIS